MVLFSNNFVNWVNIKHKIHFLSTINYKAKVLKWFLVNFYFSILRRSSWDLVWFVNYKDSLQRVVDILLLFFIDCGHLKLIHHKIGRTLSKQQYEYVVIQSLFVYFFEWKEINVVYEIILFQRKQKKIIVNNWKDIIYV